MPTKNASTQTVSDWVDPDDAPELTDEFYDRAEICDGDRILKRGRPPIAYPKKLVSIRLEPNVLVRLRDLGPGWQTKVNEVLKEYVDRVNPIPPFNGLGTTDVPKDR